jgi:hypothetical protein
VALLVVTTFLAVPFHIVLVMRARPVFLTMLPVPGIRLVRIYPESHSIASVQPVFVRQLPDTLPVIAVAVIVVPG